MRLDLELSVDSLLAAGHSTRFYLNKSSVCRAKSRLHLFLYTEKKGKLEKK